MSDDLDCGCDGTDVVSMARVERADGSIIRAYDAFLLIDQYDSSELNPAAVSAAAAALPQLLGSGTLSDLQVAMSRDPALLEMVQELAGLTAGQAGKIFGRVEQILLRWTGADAKAIDARGPNINGRWVAAIEAITGSSFEQAAVGVNPRQDAASMLAVEWQEWVTETAAKLLGQVGLGETLMPGLSFAAGAFFVKEEGATLAAALDAIAANAPQGLAEATSYWHLMLGTLSRLADEFGLTEAQIDSAAAAHVGALPFTVAQLGAAIVAGDASAAMAHLLRLRPRRQRPDRRSGRRRAGQRRHWRGRLRPRQRRGQRPDPGRWRQGRHPLHRRRPGRGQHPVHRHSAGRPDLDRLRRRSPRDLRFRSRQRPVRYHDRAIRFADGSTRHVTDSNVLISADGGRIVFGSRTADSELAGGPGSDLLIGFDRADTYLVGPDGGNDTVREQGGLPSPNDRLVIDAPRSDVVFALVEGTAGCDVVLRFLSTGAEIVILNQRLTGRAIERFEFSDGISLTLAQVDDLLNTGTDAGETILGSMRNDVIDGRGGDDLLRGGEGQDRYLFGPDSGRDRIQESDIGNKIVLADGIVAADLLFERGGERGLDLVVRLAGSEAGLTIENGLRQPYVTEFLFADGSTINILQVLAGLSQAVPNEINGTDRADDLYGMEPDERLNGGLGDDRLDGGEGNDIYVFSAGRDTIYDNGLSIDTLLAPVGATIADLRIGRQNNQVVISFRGHDGAVVLNNDFGADSGYGSTDFTSSSFSEGGYGDVEIVGFGNGDAVLLSVDHTVGTAGNDLLFDLSYSDRVYAPGAGDDVILSGPNDTTFVFEPGFGNVLILDQDGRFDTIEFTDAAVTAAELSFERNGFDVTIRIAGEAGSITVQDQLLPNAYLYDNRAVDLIRFADGSTIDSEAIVALLSASTDGDDWIAAGVRDGGAGNDLLVGNDEAQSYVFAAGYGHDAIKDFGWDEEEDYPWGRQEDVVTLVGLNQADVAFSLAPDDPHSILLTIVATGETLRIDRTPYDGNAPQDDYRHYMIERFDFADGTSLTGLEVRQQLLDALATPGDDVFEGLGIETVADGGAGNDLIGISGGGAVVLTAGGGQDVVWFSGQSERLNIVVRGADPASLIVRPVNEAAGIVGEHIRFELPDGSSLTVLHGRSSGGGGETLMAVEGARRGSIGDILFDDGTTIFYDGQLAGLVPGRTIGTAGNDGLVGGTEEDGWTPADDLFDPGAGDDLIDGKGGDDRIVFGRGSGADEVLPDWKGNAGTYTVAMLPGITPEDLRLRLSDDGQTLVVGFEDAPDTISIPVETVAGIEFSDGRILSFADAAQFFYEYPGAVVEGGAGDDEIVSGYGEVTVLFGPGDGVNRLSDQTFDSLIGWDATGYYWFGNRIAFSGVEGPADLIFARNGDSLDLVVIIRATGDRILVSNQFAGSGTTDDPTRLEAVVTEFHFDDGSILAWADAQALVEDLDPDTIPVMPNPLVTYFDLGELRGTPTDGAETLYVHSYEEVDSLGGGDRIVALGGETTLAWGGGDGDDRFEAGARSGGNNRIRFDDVDGPLGLQLLRGGDDLLDLIVVNRATGERLTIADQFVDAEALPAQNGNDPILPVAMFQFADGSELSWLEMFRFIEGVDYGGDNEVVGGDGGSTIDGGAGSDTLVGGPGDDVYLFDRAYDEDSIRDQGGSDVVVFGQGVALGDVFFSRTADGGLLIEVTGLDRLALLIDGQFAAESRRIETFLFAGGDRIGWDQVEQVILRNDATTGADTIIGFESRDFIAGDDGNDSLRGAGGDDRIDGGAGRDAALFAGTRDQYQVTDNGDGSIEVRDLVAGRDGTDLLTGIEDLRFLGEPDETELLPVAPENHAPTVATLALGGTEDQPLAIALATLLGQADDADGDPLRITGVIGVTGGQAWLGSDSQLRFRPDPDFNGVATIRYQVADPNGGLAIGVVAVNVAAVNDAPVAGFDPAGVAQVHEDMAPIQVARVVAGDADGDTLSYAIVGGDPAGLFQIGQDGWISTMRAASDADVGGHALVVEVSDGHGDPVRLTIPVEVVGINDVPAGASVSESVLEDGAALSGILAAPDADAAGPLDFSLDQPIDGFSLSPDGAWTFDPGDDAFQSLAAGEVRIVESGYTVADGAGGIGSGSFAFTVTGVNDAPEAGVAPDGVESLVEDGAPGIVAAIEAYDIDGDSLGFAIVNGNAGGLFAIDAAGAIASTRAAGDADVGLHLLKVAVSDGHGGTSLVEVAVQVIGINDVPVAQPASAAALEDGTLLTGTLVAVDPDPGESLAFALEAPVAGLALQPGGTWTFDPAHAAYQGLKAGEQRIVVANYRVTDPAGTSSVSTLTITLTGVNDAPQAALDPASPRFIAENAAPAQVAALIASDIDGDVLSFAIASGNAGNLFAVNSAGRISTVRVAGDADVGLHTLRIDVSDGKGGVSRVDVAVTVGNVNDAPVVAAPVADQVWQAGTAEFFALPQGTFTDADGDALALSASLANGTALPAWLSFNAQTGTFTGTPPANTAGSLAVRVAASDGQASAFDEFLIAIEAAGGGGGSTAGFAFHSLNSWYDPRWGGGYNVTFRYTVQAEAIVGGQLKLWDILANYDGLGEVLGGWVSGFGGPTVQTTTGEGLTYSTVGTGYQPNLRVGDSFLLSLRVDGARFETDDFDFIIFDRDPPPNPADAGDTRVLAQQTVNWPGGLLQNVGLKNISADRIDDWRVVLDLPGNAPFNLTSVWGATATRLANGDMLFEGTNVTDVIAPGGQANFGFTAAYPGSPLHFDASSFSFI